MATSVVVIGAGQAGLSMSRHLTGAGLDHVVLERGEVANSWRTERWDSLRLLTPNWMTVLPGLRYRGDDPDGFMTAAEAATFLEAYRTLVDAPVVTEVEVSRVQRCGSGFVVDAGEAQWHCDAVVVATGGSSEPHLPMLARDLPASIGQLTAKEYKRPAQLDLDGRVLVVGASASGVQIAEELRRAGAQVTLSVGEHVRMCRSYRGRDIYRWMHAIGQLDERFDEVEDIERARRHASVQLVGSDDHRTLDLNALQAHGVQVVGRLMAVDGWRAACSGGLGALVANADLKLGRLLDRIDEYAGAVGPDPDGSSGPADRPEPTRLGDVPTELDLRRFSTVVWGTGYRPTWSWLEPSALDRRGRLLHDGGVARLPGLYVLGLPFLRRRRSNLIAGVGDDAADLTRHLRARLDGVARAKTLIR